MTIHADDRDDLPMVRCRECSEDFAPIEMQGDYCIDCTILRERLNQKRKGDKNDDGKHTVDHDV